MRDFDELLDEVLKKEAGVEPRVGMEQRVLVRVRAEETGRIGWGRRWLFAPALVSGGLLVAVAVNHRFSRRDRFEAPVLRAVAPPVVTMQESVQSDSQEVPELKGAQSPPHTRRKQTPLQTASANANLEQAREEGLPKMDTFPAVTQKGSLLAGWKSDDVQSSEATQALLQLKAEQERPLQVNEIEIQPL